MNLVTQKFDEGVFGERTDDPTLVIKISQVSTWRNLRSSRLWIQSHTENGWSNLGIRPVPRARKSVCLNKFCLKVEYVEARLRSITLTVFTTVIGDFSGKEMLEII